MFAEKMITNIKDYIREFKKKKFYSTKNLDKSRTELSPSGKYELTIESFKTGEGTWNYTRGTVRNVATGKKIAVVDRNYSSFWKCWAENHPDGHDYLLCGEDYQGQTIVRLDEPERLDYLPETAEKGFGFCWAGVEISPDKTIVVVEGCYWGAPYEVRFYDFIEPLKHPVELAYATDRYNRFFGWKDNDTVLVGYEEQYRKSDGKSFKELSYEEQDEAENNNDDDYRDVKLELKMRGI